LFNDDVDSNIRGASVILSFLLSARLTAYVSIHQSAIIDKSINQVMGKSSLVRLGMLMMVLLVVVGILYGIFQ
jgi:hypothetical protein